MVMSYFLKSLTYVLSISFKILFWVTYAFKSLTKLEEYNLQYVPSLPCNLFQVNIQAGIHKCFFPKSHKQIRIIRRKVQTHHCTLFLFIELILKVKDSYSKSILLVARWMQQGVSVLIVSFPSNVIKGPILHPAQSGNKCLSEVLKWGAVKCTVGTLLPWSSGKRLWD